MVNKLQTKLVIWKEMAQVIENLMVEVRRQYPTENFANGPDRAYAHSCVCAQSFSQSIYETIPIWRRDSIHYWSHWLVKYDQVRIDSLVS